MDDQVSACRHSGPASSSPMELKHPCLQQGLQVCHLFLLQLLSQIFCKTGSSGVPPVVVAVAVINLLEDNVELLQTPGIITGCILYSSRCRVIGKGILPPQQRQLDLLAKMLTFLCERLISECRIFQINGWPMLEHTYQELLAWHGNTNNPLEQKCTVCGTACCTLW